jgi:hypothetical protein
VEFITVEFKLKYSKIFKILKNIENIYYNENVKKIVKIIIKHMIIKIKILNIFTFCVPYPSI